MANTTDRLYRMPIGDFLRRRPEAQTCQACGSPLPQGAVFCPSCGVRADDPQAEPLHIVDRATGLLDRKSTRLNSSHGYISYAVFCLKKKKPSVRGDCSAARSL